MQNIRNKEQPELFSRSAKLLPCVGPASGFREGTGTRTETGLQKIIYSNCLICN